MGQIEYMSLEYERLASGSRCLSITIVLMNNYFVNGEFLGLLQKRVYPQLNLNSNSRASYNNRTIYKRGQEYMSQQY